MENTPSINDYPHIDTNGKNNLKISGQDNSIEFKSGVHIQFTFNAGTEKEFMQGATINDLIDMLSKHFEFFGKSSSFINSHVKHLEKVDNKLRERSEFKPPTEEQIKDSKLRLKILDKSLVAAGVEISCPIRDNNYM